MSNRLLSGKIILPEIVAYRADCQHFLNNFDCTSKRISGKICEREKKIKFLLDLRTFFSWNAEKKGSENAFHTQFEA